MNNLTLQWSRRNMNRALSLYKYAKAMVTNPDDWMNLGQRLNDCKERKRWLEKKVKETHDLLRSAKQERAARYFMKAIGE